jgi:glutamine synthetase
MLTREALDKQIADGDVDTVIVAFCDMQGRLTGKRVSARLFAEDVADHGAECCNYLLAVDVDNNTVDGYAISSWETGYGDMVMTPDYSTLRLLPWLPGTAMVMADLSWTDGKPVKQAPRSILNRQIDRLSERGLVPYVGTELEFMVFDDAFRDAWRAGYRGLTPATDYNVDYAMHASTRMEPLLRDIRLGMEGAGLYCEGVKGECNLGQQEIAFRYAPGGDVNPYLAVAAMIAAGIDGIERELALEDVFVGNAYDSDKPRLPTTLAESAELFRASGFARRAFGDDVVEHYLNNARVELEAFAAVVTDWERVRGFERG